MVIVAPLKKPYFYWLYQRSIFAYSPILHSYSIPFLFPLYTRRYSKSVLPWKYCVFRLSKFHNVQILIFPYTQKLFQRWKHSKYQHLSTIKNRLTVNLFTQKSNSLYMQMIFNISKSHIILDVFACPKTFNVKTCCQRNTFFVPHYRKIFGSRISYILSVIQDD